MSSITPLTLDISAAARQEFSDLLNWLLTNAPDSAQKFTTIFYAEIANLCQATAEQIATGGRPAFLPDETASLRFSRPAYRATFTTQKARARRSSSGTYCVYYTLLDANKDGQVDTLSVLSIRHAAARPVWDVDSYDPG